MKHFHSIFIFANFLFLTQVTFAEVAPDRITVSVDSDRSFVHGSASRADFNKAVISAMPQVETCYQIQLKANPASVGGDVSAEFTTSPSGKVTLISTQGSVPYADVKSCIASAFRRTPFPKSSDFVNAKYTLVFGLEHQEVKTLDPKTKSNGPEKIQSAAPAVSGISKDVSAKIIGAKMGEIDACYQKQLDQKADLRGNLSVKFVIEKSGDVSSAVTSNTTLHDPPTENCINEIFRHMKFPPPPGNDYVEITYPMVFRPEGREKPDTDGSKVK